MNLALWKKAYREVRVTLPFFVLLMFGFEILHAWVSSQIDLRFLEGVLQAMPDLWKRIVPVSIGSLASYAGRIAVGYDHPLVAFSMAFWAISAGRTQ